MIYRMFNLESDYPMIYSWWKTHNSKIIEPDLIPPFGIVIEDGEPVLASFMFLGGNAVAQIAWSVSNPTSSPAKRGRALLFAIDTLETMANKAGCRSIITMSSEPGLTKAFQRRGFTKMQPHDFLVKEHGGQNTKFNGGIFCRGKALPGDAPMGNEVGDSGASGEPAST